MPELSAIEWTNGTFNPWWGCSRVSPACAHCYADSAAKRFGDPGLWEVSGPRKFFGDAHWNELRRWNNKAAKAGVPKLVFCASMADVFERHADPLVDAKLEEERGRLWSLIEETPWLTWQLLTKRPELIEEMVPDPWLDGFPPNVWVGTSVENARFTWRAGVLEDIPARVRFLSCEPLLGSLFDESGNRVSLERNLHAIEWVIGGGESGPNHRPTNPEWAREIRDACVERGIPFFWKQWGGARPKSGGKELDGREWCELPDPYVPQYVLA